MEKNTPPRVVSTPVIQLNNPPAPLFARGDQTDVDLFGAISLVSLTGLTQFSVYDPLEDRREKGIFEDDPEADAGDQLKDLQFISMKMDTEEPGILLERLTEFFNALEKMAGGKASFLGILELEANAFERSVHLEIEQGVIDKLVSIHKKFRDQTTFPTVEKHGLFSKNVRVRFVGQESNVTNFYPVGKGWKLGDLVNHYNNVHGFIAGIVVTTQDGIAEFHILANSLRSLGLREAETQIDWATMKALLSSVTTRQKVPLSWFRLDVGLSALESLFAYDEIRDRPEFKALVERYNERLSLLLQKKYKRLLKEVSGEKQVDIEALKKDEERCKKEIQDLMEAILDLDKMLEETEEVDVGSLDLD
ncbi:MAG: hypothetical protein ACTSU5_13915 [Promethearchaeota archaeon]